MVSLDENFQVFILELENKNLPERTVLRYTLCYRCLKNLMPEITIETFDADKILTFIEKLKEIKIWDEEVNEYTCLKPVVILNFINYLWSFFVWLKKQEVHNNQVKNETKLIVNKLLFLKIYRDRFDLLLKPKHSEIAKMNSPNIYISNDLLIKQLTRRFNSFFNLSNPVFFKGIADYIRYISGINQLLDIVKTNILEQEKSDFLQFNQLPCHLEEIRQNSEWGSWFNLELVYLIIYKMRELLENFKSEYEIIIFLKSYIHEMQKIMTNCLHFELIHFPRDTYNIDLIRVHNYLLEILEQCHEIKYHDTSNVQNIYYKFSDYDIPSGMLTIKGFDTIYFTKNPAVVLQYYYLNRGDDAYYSYKDFNEFLGSGKQNLASNEFRLLINSINRRVKNKTAGVIKKILIRKQSVTKVRETNSYKFFNSN